MFTIEANNGDDIIDVRDIIARVEGLRELRQPGPVDTGNPDDEDKAQDDLFAELATLEAFLDALAGNGGDEEWEGSWYPTTLIRDRHFEDYARELAEDCGLIRDDASWPYRCIDWEKAASELRMDYTPCELEDVTYWYR